MKILYFPMPATFLFLLSCTTIEKSENNTSKPKVSHITGIKKEDLKYHPTGVVQYTGSQVVEIKKNKKITIRIEVSTKGNGNLTITSKNDQPFVTKIYDDHDNGYIYENSMLNYWFEDLNSDSQKELIISGVGIKTSSKGEIKEKILKSFEYDSNHKKWRKI